MILNGWRVAIAAALVSFAAGCAKKDEGGKKAAAKETSGQGKSVVAEEAGEPTPSAEAKAGKMEPGAEGPIASVNGVEVSRDEFDRKYAKMTKAFTTRKKDIPENLARRYRESILNQLIEKELLSQKIKAAGIAVPTAEIETEFENYKKMFRTEENFQRYLNSSQVDVDQIKENVQHNQAVNKLLEKEAELNVTDAEAKEYYDKNRARYAIKEQLRASHILLKVDPKAEKGKIEEVRKTAQQVYKEAKKTGADFAELAKKHSEGPTASRGGDLSYFGRGRMVKEFDEVAFKMKVGEISKPVKTQFGWHVINVTDRKEARERPFDEVKESIVKNLRARKVRKAKQELLKKLRAEAKVESFLPKAEPSAAEAAKEAGELKLKVPDAPTPVPPPAEGAH